MSNKSITNLIYNSGKLFIGLNVPIVSIKAVLQHKAPLDVSSSEIDIILRLKRGLDYIINHKSPLTLSIFQHLNAITTPDSLEPGHFALHPMFITGVKWQPPKPNPKRAKYIINHYKKNKDSARITAIKIMLQFDRYQFFWNGNKRTAWLAANYYLLQHGAGILNISHHQEKTWNTLLADFYETGHIQRITKWLNHDCIMSKI